MLGTFGGPSSEAYDVNERGWLGRRHREHEGKSRSGSPVSHAFVWQNGRLVDLGTLGGPSSYAVAVNERG
jgi:probable HAF family extracellular repeat protein